MSEQNPNEPPMPPGMPPAPPGMPPAPPGMPPAPPGMPAAPPGMPAAPPGMPPAPPGMPAAPPGMPAAPPGMPAAPPGMPPAPPGMPAAPPGMPAAPPGMPAAPPGMPAAPPGMPAAPPGMPPAPPGMPAAPEMPPAPPEMPSAPPEMPPAPPEMPPAPPEMPPAPPEMPPAPEEKPSFDALLAPPAPEDEDLVAPAAPAEMPSLDAPLSPPAPDAEDLLAPPVVAVEESDIVVIDPLAPVSPVGDDFVAAGAKIRRSSEIDDVPGDKLEGALHETETSTLNADGEIIKQDVKGVLTVRNPSESDRIYDIDVMLNNTVNTSLAGDHVQVDELESRKEFSTKYKVKNSRMLVMRERLDTNPDRDQERSLSVSKGGEGGPLNMEIEVENVSGVSLTDVLVTREMPSQMKMAPTGGADIEGNELSWDIGQLSAGETKTLSLSGTIHIDGIKPVKAGVTKATYKADATLSTLSFRELDAFCRGFAYINSVEAERPDNWECKTIFENRSSFTVDLVKLQVSMKGSDDLLFDISDVPEDVLPDSRWESDTVNVESTGKPDFTWDLGYTVLPRASHSTEGSIELQPSTFEVLDASVIKNYSKTVLPSYRRHDLNAVITIKNEGSSPINAMRLTDDIPGLFDAPAAEDISVRVGSNDLTEAQFKAEISAGVTIEKELRSPDGAGHTLNMTIGLRSPLHLNPGKTLTISYPLVAPDPSPGNEEVAGPVRFEFCCEKYGPMCAREVEEVPIIRVRHHRRNFSAGKSVMPMGGKGRYEVLIMFENDGDTALQDVCINDTLPSNFELKDWSVRGAGRSVRDDVTLETSKSESGSSNVWSIPVVEKGERLEVSFEIKGEGEVDAEVLNQFHGVTFGDEVEEDVVPTTSTATHSDDSSDESSDDSTDEPGAGYKWREDVLLRIMASHGIDESHRDDFVRHAVNFDIDDNLYLKKAELETAAAAWGGDESAEEAPAEEAPAEEAPAEEAPAEEAPAEEAPAEEAPAEETSGKNCPICSAGNSPDSTTCESCGFAF